MCEVFLWGAYLFLIGLCGALVILTVESIIYRLDVTPFKVSEAYTLNSDYSCVDNVSVKLCISSHT